VGKGREFAGIRLSSRNKEPVAREGGEWEKRTRARRAEQMGGGRYLWKLEKAAGWPVRRLA
jgi:hypothetical protein